MHSLPELRKMDLATLNKELEKARFGLNKVSMMVKVWKEKANHKITLARRLVSWIRTIINEVKLKDKKKVWDSKQV